MLQFIEFDHVYDFGLSQSKIIVILCVRPATVEGIFPKTLFRLTIIRLRA